MRAYGTFMTLLAVTWIAGAASGEEARGHLVLNGDVHAVLETEGGAHRLAGRVNGYLTLRGDSFEGGADVVALNVALFGVDQQAITGYAAPGKPTGVVGFSAVAPGEKRQGLRYDAQSGALVGTVAGRVDLSQFLAVAEPRIDPKNDLVEIPTMPAALEVRIGLRGLGDLAAARKEPIERRIEVALDLEAREAADLPAAAFALGFRGQFVEAQLVFWPWIEVGRRLCIQPVRILSLRRAFPPHITVSGDGLPFGQPGANREWTKADVVFTYRDWITIFASQFSTFSSDESSDLLSRVDVDDCIEVFFVDRFSPQDLFGGGATFGLGTASSKVISSDENADFGVDLTHLAHELGHVLALPHPTATNVSSTGTLMCPSGFNNDNPQRNSQENKDNLSNPLLTFTLKVVTPGPDCQDSSDCGPCP